MSEENVAIVRAIVEADAMASKEEIFKGLPELVPVLFLADAEWVEAPERVDAKTHRGHAGIRESVERWLDRWEDYHVDALRFEDHHDSVLVVARESGRGHRGGAATDAIVYSVISFRDGKISRYRDLYDEANARATLDRRIRHTMHRDA